MSLFSNGRYDYSLERSADIAEITPSAEAGVIPRQRQEQVAAVGQGALEGILSLIGSRIRVVDLKYAPSELPTFFLMAIP